MLSLIVAMAATPEQKFRMRERPRIEYHDPCPGLYYCPPLAETLGISEQQNRRMWLQDQAKRRWHIHCPKMRRPPDGRESCP